MTDAPHVAANIDRFLGFADLYDKYRPTPPIELIPILTQMARIERPPCVVDIGCGTGLSTRIWADHADQVIGIEPNDEMRAVAEARSAAFPNIRYQKGFSTATGLPDASTDIVTVSQALHWMEPTATFAEIGRVLRPGGVFAAIDNDFPPTFDWEAERAGENFLITPAQLLAERGLESDGKKWAKDEHLARIAASGQFRYTKEIALDHVEMGDADRMVGVELSQAGIQLLLKAGVSEEEIGIPALRAEAKRILGDTTLFWHFTYRVRLGVK